MKLKVLTNHVFAVALVFCQIKIGLQLSPPGMEEWCTGVGSELSSRGATREYFFMTDGAPHHLVKNKAR